ncbi:MAG: Eco57I restriction-modification methylase domain-containing protein, partial [Myxococcota bacterium]
MKDTNHNAREILRRIIENFSIEQFTYFFREKTQKFAPRKDTLTQYNEENFINGEKLGEIRFIDSIFIISTFKVTKGLTERSGKKKQYELGKKILKDTNSDAGIFIFYDSNGNFRFSLIYTEYSGTKRKFSYFKRFTFYVSPSLTNKTFLQQIGECKFTSLEEIKEAFSVEPVTKQFYEEIQNWYFWAMDRIKFPEDYKYSDDPEKDREIRNATNLIRLITRIIFIWFLKEKGLVPEVLFTEEKLKEVVKDFGRSSNYYNAILQNLFFATLNQKMSERRFARDDGYPANKSEYGVKTFYRYADRFLISKDKVLELFKEIPFLNGGLFDCLDKEDESGRVIYVDGFSRNPKKQVILPDLLFFQKDPVRVNLSAYGLGSNKPVRGLIEILKNYNFTIDENTPIDQEIALDPELLGKVFENLLASYNPETATTARKATGSYYTPREIVDYMVEESLKEYIKTQVPETKEEDIELLLSYSEEMPDITDNEKKKVITAIDNIKILDPACGSGAFPMGILHKLVHILQKLDPENKHWYELQYQKALSASEEIFKKGDKSEREESLKEINEAFDENINYPDYARKLYLIENCIYGVDIQPIAIQISKLRFFISLVLDQKVDRAKENLGIRALPNLETKFVAANTLIEIGKPTQLKLRNPEIEKKEKELKELRHRYFTVKTRTEKQRLQQKDKKLREDIANLLIHDGWGEQTAEKIATFDLFDQNASADWFDPEWMFGANEGFDIVIGNPPYVRQERIKELKPIFQKQGYKVYVSTADLYTYFYEKGYDLLNSEGILCFISSNKWMRAKYGEKLRKFLKENTNVLTLIDFGGYPVFEQTVDTNIILFQKEKPDDNHQLKFVNVGKVDGGVIEYIRKNQNTIPQ